MVDLAPGEFVEFARADPVPGVEIATAYHVESQVAAVPIEYGVAMPTSWSGEAFCERRIYSVVPGTVFCREPGNPFQLARVHQAGWFKVLMFEPRTFRGYLAEHEIGGDPRWLRTLHAMSPELARRLVDVFDAYSSQATAMHLQTSLTEFVAVMARELVRTRSKKPIPFESSAPAAQRIREYLHEEDGPALDLDTLAEHVGMTRFKVLRVFKKQFGVTPHEYQICSRIWRARDLLRQGETPARVAACCGFADQSHFIRHFKRRLGVTPGQYARASRAERGALIVRPDLGERGRTAPRASLKSEQQFTSVRDRTK
jgi:AraC-like DNA-binding protein